MKEKKTKETKNIWRKNRENVKKKKPTKAKFIRKKENRNKY